MNQTLERFDKAGTPVGREAHDFEFVTIAEEAEILSDSCIEDSQRVREVDAVEHFQPAVLAECKRCTDEIAEAVQSADGGILESGNEEGAGQMGRMMLDEMNLR